MVGTSKILTVSYGTFSCTLEGFDDSFNTMKAIAEYFRGLAADDRYFGAEPPTPDAEMLASIAEREIARRVEAHQGDNGIHLRAAALEAPASDASVDAPVTPEDAPAAAPVAAKDAPTVPEDTPDHDAESRAKVAEERKAAKAARRAAKAKEKAEREAIKAERRARKAAKAEAAALAAAEARAQADLKDAQVEKADDADANTDTAAQSVGEGVAEAQAALDQNTLADAPEDDTSILDSVSAATAAASEGTSGSDVEETRDDAPSSMLATEDPAPETFGTNTEVPAHPDADSVAAKLQRIRAVVGNASDEAVAAPDDPEAQFLPQNDAPDVNDDVDAVAEFDAHVAELDADTPAAVADAPVAEPDLPVAEPDAPAAEADAPAADVNAPEAEAEQPVARVIRMKRSDMVDTDPSGPDLGLLDGADELDAYLEDSDYTDADLSPMDEADLSEELQALEDAVSDVSEEPSREDTAVGAVSGLMSAQNDDATAEPEVEAETVAGAQVDAEAEANVDIVADDPDDLAEDDSYDEDDADMAAAPAKGFLAEEPHVDDAALDRLMSETDAKLNEPEGSRRRDAIAQLKAAVAAKEAARQVGEADDDGQDVENAFRNDLSEAVGPDDAAGIRPRPVVRATTRTERPRPAPLKLVAAQRVDLPEGEKRDGPVVPRRVAARKDDAEQTQAAGSFAEFAENMGASALPDLLEAAAAYTSFVEGADEFSRPQILRRVRTVASDDFNREDGLRSFADLLREGRFTKVRNGRFQVADDSRFNPERRVG